MHLRSLLFFVLAVAAALLSPLVPRSFARAPTNEEQLMVELVNRMRANPQAELAKLVNITTVPSVAWGSPKSTDSSTTDALNAFGVNPTTLYNQWQLLTPAPPVAWNEQLAVSALTYSNVMVLNDAQAHNLDEHKFPNGDVDLIGRIEASGYTFVDRPGSNDNDFAGESIYAYAASVQHGHAAFAIDWGTNPPSGIQNPAGHRDLIMDARMREIGVGIVVDTSSATKVGPRVITQHYAVDDDDGPVLTGVIYRENDNNSFYSVGEGLGGITVVATDLGNGQKFMTTTYGSGGYNLALPAGHSYNLVASGPGLGQFSATGLFLGTDNVKYDFVTSTTPRLGDANMDGVVNRADIAILTSNFGLNSGALWGHGDFNFDGKITVGDLAILQRNLSAPGSPVAVPEPASLAIALPVLLAATFFRRRRRAKSA
ncbi:MAG: dockerin type I domain-containing protein [Pirellulales bacterium]